MNTRLYQALFILLLLSIWQFVPATGLINPHFLTPLSEVLKTLWRLSVSGQLHGHLAVSLKRILLGLGMSIVIGCPLGLLMGWFKDFEKVVDAPLQAGRQISALALFPVFILFFGIGELSKVVIIFWASIWPILLNTIAGVQNIDPLLIKSARSMGASGGRLLMKLILPAVTPSILTGIRLGGAYAVMVLVAAEMVGANSGLGFLVLNSQETFKIPEMYAGIIALGLFGLLINNLLLALEKRTTRWKETRESN